MPMRGSMPPFAQENFLRRGRPVERPRVHLGDRDEDAKIAIVSDAGAGEAPADDAGG